jgi:predicted RecA/RadA family phage recombinase
MPPHSFYGALADSGAGDPLGRALVPPRPPLPARRSRTNTQSAPNRRGAVRLKLTLTLSCGGAPYSPTPSPNGSRRRWAARRRSRMPPCRSTGTRPPARRPVPTASGVTGSRMRWALVCAAAGRHASGAAMGRFAAPPVPAQDVAMRRQLLARASYHDGTGKGPWTAVCAARGAASQPAARSSTPAPLRTSPSQ